MKNRLLGLTILILASGSVWWVLRKPFSPTGQPTALEHGPAGHAADSESYSPSHLLEESVDGEKASPGILPGPVQNQPKRAALASAEIPPLGPEAGDPGSGLTPQTVLENVRSVFRQYHQRFGANPVGDNAEITATLNGQNPARAVLLNSEDGLRLNDRGELIDNWGTPFFFHQLSRTEMEIHSAGPDRKMWSQDDLVLK